MGGRSGVVRWVRLSALVALLAVALPLAVGAEPSPGVVANPTISVADASIVEGNGGTGSLSFAVTLSAPSSGPVAVQAVTIPRTANGHDFVLRATTLRIKPGATGAQFTVKITGDDVVEADEQFDVLLTGETGGTLGRSEAVGTILDDDPGAAVSIGVGDIIVVEGDAGSRKANVAVVLSEVQSNDVGVNVSLTYLDASAADVKPLSKRLKIAAGKTSANVGLTLLPDTEDEPDEVAALVLSDPTGASIARGFGTVTLLDDDESAPPPDLDGDGYPPPADCDDADPSVHPGAIDLPDEDFVDSDCDGIDAPSTGVFVSQALGSDVAGCGTTAAPCASIAYASAIAAPTSSDVLVAGGSYAAFELLDGVSVYGGFGQNFQRDPALATGLRVATVNGNSSFPGQGQAITVLADGLALPTVLADLTLNGADVAAPGQSSQVVVVRDTGANLTIARNQIAAGGGANGASGAGGLDAEFVDRQPPMNGGQGGDGREYDTLCDTSGRGAAGLSGTNAASASPSARAMNAGTGGRGGTMDTDCGFTGSCAVSGNCDARPGDNGTDASFRSGSFGKGGAGGSGLSSCGPTENGGAGLAVNGAAGPPGSRGVDAQGYLTSVAGGAGGTGENGGGGGGGGGSGGCDQGTDAYGAGGGGGGAGGAAAREAGTGGSGGGSSIGILLHHASPTILDNVITRGSGGTGGSGGAGGRGQTGGLGGMGGAFPGGAVPGTGGNGAHGGHGGGGGGGTGGHSIGVLASSADSTPTSSGNTFSDGTVGAGGSGGMSAPSAPVAEDDGNDGAVGGPGVIADVRICASPTAC
jgi:hypothetical protein